MLPISPRSRRRSSSSVRRPRKLRSANLKRAPLPPHLPRIDIHNEPESTTCHCGCALKRIGEDVVEDVAEKLDNTPGTISVERHIRGKWVCDHCETLTQAPVPDQVIDKGLPTAGMLANVTVSKFADQAAASSRLPSLLHMHWRHAVMLGPKTVICTAPDGC